MPQAAVEVRPLASGDLAWVAARVAALQTEPANHLGYLPTSGDAVAVDLARLLDGPHAVVVATAGGAPGGLLASDWDDDPPRAGGTDRGCG